MKQVFKTGRLVYGIVLIVSALAVFSVATYAWFTSNRVVDTTTASARSGTQTLNLEISQIANFTPVEIANIVQVNQTQSTYLMPVSTADLQTFVYNPMTVSGVAKRFSLVENEAYYYHGQVFLRATAQNQPNNATMALYLDNSSTIGGEQVQAISGEILNAARLGLTFSAVGGPPQASVIFKLSEENNTSHSEHNTEINGEILQGDYVLQYTPQQVVAINDPSVLIKNYTVDFSETSILLPQNPLVNMELNQVYQVDVYFYLEGCDPDCVDEISYSMATMYLAFYGILTNGGAP